MKIRQAEKIIYATSIFGNWDSNYQPYSVTQQEKALKILKIPMSIRKSMLEYGVYGKIPVEYRKFNPVAIANVMHKYNMNPESIKEYRKCMMRLLKIN